MNALGLVLDGAGPNLFLGTVPLSLENYTMVANYSYGAAPRQETQGLGMVPMVIE